MAHNLLKRAPKKDIVKDIVDRKKERNKRKISTIP